MKNNNLKDTSILLIAPKFFGYDQVIEDVLTQRGALVDRLIDRPSNNSIFKALSKITTVYVTFFLERYYLKKINSYNSNYDLVFVINGQTISRKVLIDIKKRNPKAKFILYMWDSVKNRSKIVKNFDVYHSIFSFDKDSTENFNLKFRPLFFDQRPLNTDDKYKEKYAASFVGTAHSDRYLIVKKILKSFTSKQTISLYYLQARWVYLFYKLTKKSFLNAKLEDFTFEPISTKVTNDIFNSSNIIIDVEHPSQTGLTIRTFEAMRSKKKLVTTNKAIQLYDFFSYGNVHVIDRDNPFVPLDFITKRFNEYSDDIYYYYSIDGWLDEVLIDIIS